MTMTEENLCHKCLTIPWNRQSAIPWKDEIRHGFDHHDTFGELEASCETGCPLCQTLFLLLVYDDKDINKTDRLRWTFKSDFGNWMLTTETDPARGSWYIKVGPNCVRHMRPFQSITMVKRLSSSTLDGDLKSVLRDSISPWIEACLCSGKHSKCPTVAPNELESYNMPTRLVDVGTEGDTTVRLVSTRDLSKEHRKSLYTILSYRWGLANDSARTTSRNLRERFGGIVPDSLPKTIRDAIKLTRLMKIQYLWVDAMCIIQSNRNANEGQDDDDAKMDWERESSRMSSYYTNSLCCIAASNAKDSSEGILSERRTARYGGEWYNPPNVFIQSPYVARRRIPSLLFDRGWCLQEWLLSPRILHWTAQGLVWECSQGFFWEGQTGFNGESPERYTDYPVYGHCRMTNDCMLELPLSWEYTKKLCEILRAEKEEALGNSWTALVEHYSTMHLSFSGDRLAAIQGISGLLSERHGVDYFAGIFRSPCPHHLFWRSISPQNSPFDNGCFPSWSWMSSNGGVYFMAVTSPWRSWMENFEPFPPAQHQKDLVRITNKELRFTAPLISLDMMDSRDAESDDEGSGDALPGRHQLTLGPEAPVWQGLSCTIYLDSVAHFAHLKSGVFLLLLRHQSIGTTEYQGLVIRMVEGKGQWKGLQDDKKTYWRIGFFEVRNPERDPQELPGLAGWAKKIVLL